MELKTILVALDLAEEGGNAVLARAIQLAGEHGAWLVLLHVIETEGLPQAAVVSGQMPASRLLISAEKRPGLGNSTRMARLNKRVIWRSSFRKSNR